MATIYQIPFSISFPYRKPLFYDHRHHQQPQLLVSHLNSTRKLGFICFACSVKQTRVRKRVKSNEDLRIEIMEFVALTGLPEGHVPSMKELSAHGRVDLANIVRRRGYKFIRDLLASSSNLEDCNELVSEDMETSSSGICLEDSLTESQGKEALDAVDEDLSTKQPSSIEIYFSSTDGSITLDQEKNNVSVEDLIANSSHKAEEHGRLAEDESLLAGISNMESQGKEALDAVDEDLSTKQPSSTEMYLTSTDGCIPLDQEKIDVSVEDLITNSSHEAEEHGRLTEDESSLAGISIMENSLSSFDDSSHSGDITETDLDIECMEQNNRAGTENSYSETSVSADHSVVLDNSSSCSERESDNVLMTEDKEVNDGDGNFSLTYDHYTTQDLNYTIATESTAVSFQSQQIDDMAENRSGSGDDSFVESDGKDWMLGLSSSTSNIEEKTARFIQNGYLDTVDGDEYIGDSYGGQRSVSTLPNGNDIALEEVTLTTEVNSFDRNSDQRDGNADLDNSNDETLQRENQVEITRLRFMLRQKELELSRLKEQIEKEKLSLSVLQRQAETEIQKAQMLISEKDVELQEAEGNLTGLQEVEIEYCGDGNVVEVTGSFNGWQHRVVLEHQASKSIGKEKWWSTLLWLYPGRYEIKFIVDGQWTTDPLKDSVTRGHITNNILKVDTS